MVASGGGKFRFADEHVAAMDVLQIKYVGAKVDEAVPGVVLGGKACGLGGGSRGRFRCFGAGIVGLVGACDAELEYVEIAGELIVRSTAMT